MCFSVLYDPSKLKCQRLLKYSFMEGKDLYIWYSQYHGCRYPGDARSQGISSYGIDLFLSEYSGLSTRGINSLATGKSDSFYKYYFQIGFLDSWQALLLEVYFCVCKVGFILLAVTCWGFKKMADVLQMAIQMHFLMKMFVVWFKFHLSLYVGVQLMI